MTNQVFPKDNFNPTTYKDQIVAIIDQIDSLDKFTEKKFLSILKKYPKAKQGFFSKSDLISGFKHFSPERTWSHDLDSFATLLKKKPIRTQSGVTPVTVLTKPFPCPGKCIFCPNDIRMPKSYLSDEPGAQRATRNNFDPYLQTYNRIKAFAQNGHNIDKIELIILGGTWSFYPEPYQLWFITRCLQAMNDYGAKIDGRNQVKKASDFLDTDKKLDIDGTNITSTYNHIVSKKLVTDIGGKMLNSWETATWEELEAAQKANELSNCRNVGLVIETRPDHISKTEVIRIRRLGCTKAQIGYQSLSDKVLDLNKRGHDVAATRRAMKLLRAAGFKIHAHWMANLYGSSVEEDIQDFQKMFSDPDFMPDELKIYPCSLIQTAELMQYYQKGLWQPYTHDQLLKVLTECINNTPQYCRLTRVIRDIPSTDIVVGNKMTNFRQIAETELTKTHKLQQDIRAREIRDDSFTATDLKLDEITYVTSTSTEKFLQFVTPKNKIVGFLRLSLPKFTSEEQKKELIIPELDNSAIIREIHVYGVTAKIGERHLDKAQHLGLGKKLIVRALEISKMENYQNLAVISAIGTREYYRKQGFTDGQLYQHLRLKT